MLKICHRRRPPTAQINISAGDEAIPERLHRIAHLRRLPVIVNRQAHIFKKPKMRSNRLKLGGLTDSRKNFLPGSAQQLHPALTHQFVSILSESDLVF